MATNVSVRGTITNSSHGDLHLPQDFPNHHDWSGHVEGSYPNIIPQDENITFTHRGEGPDGSVAAVIYSGKCNAHASGDDCGWLLAWQVKSAGGNNSNKVYVECGVIDQFKPDKISWDDIRDKLRRSAKHSKCEDQATNTRASADINDRKYPAEMVATFSSY